MKTYSVLFAEDVPHYGFAEIEAEDDAAALEAAKSYDLSEVTNDPEKENSVCKRIVHIESPQGNMVHYDVPLDGFFLRSGGEKDRLLCDSAQDLLRLVEMVAAGNTEIDQLEAIANDVLMKLRGSAL